MGTVTVANTAPPTSRPSTAADQLIAKAVNHNSSSQSSADKSNSSLKPKTGAEASSGEGEFDIDLLDPALAGAATASDWTPEELVILENSLARYPGDKFPAVERYVQVAAGLPNKTARDVALRVKAQQQEDKRRKGAASDDDAAKRKGAAPPPPPRMAQAAASSRPATGTGAAGGAAPSGANDAGNDAASIPTALTQLMEHNYHILSQFKSNMAQFKVVENTDLLTRYRDNLVAMQQQLSSIGGIMAQMPPLPVQPNLDLAGKFLPPKGATPLSPMGPMSLPFGPPGAGLPPLQMDAFFGAGGPSGMGGPMGMAGAMGPMGGMGGLMQGLSGAPGMPGMQGLMAGMPGLMPGMAGMAGLPGMPGMSGTMAGMPGMPGSMMAGTMPGSMMGPAPPMATAMSTDLSHLGGMAAPLLPLPMQLPPAPVPLPAPVGAAPAGGQMSLSRQGSAAPPIALKTEPL